jgi:methionine-gamma-lyase
MLTHFLPQKCNITTTFVDIVDLEEVDNAMIEGKTSVLYFESISNPT